MAPFSLHGLNVVQPVQRDAHDVAAPDFSAHLDLWTNLAFQSDEPLASSSNPKRDDDDDREHPNALDVNTLLNGFGIDPLLMPTSPPPPIQQNQNSTPSLAQLLALHAAYTGSYPAPAPATLQTFSSPSNPPSKRIRTQKSSYSIENSADPRTPTSASQSPEESSQPDPSSTTPSAAEDKRRRNTAASARFRLKKKEREAALERRAKELEERVVELERECEGLRRENGWLKGLVVGVTGAGAQHQQSSTK